MENIAELAAAIDREKVEDARRASIEEKLRDGPRLFAQACEMMRAGIRVTRPAATVAEIEDAVWSRSYDCRRP